LSAAFPGGLRLAGHDPRLTAQPPVAAPLSTVYTLPLAQHAGLPAEPVVAVGDRVLRGSLLAMPSDTLSAAVHAPTSGTVRLIASQPIPHPSGLTAPCIVIDADGRDEAAPPLPALDWEHATPTTLVARVREAGIVGLGGAVFPTHVKLDAPRAPELLILNGAECEPYIACDDALMKSRAPEVVQGARILLRATGASRCLIGIEDDMPAAIAALQAAVAAAGDARIQVAVVPTRYPEGGERQLIQTLTGREVPSGSLPLALGVVVQNVGTAVAVADAVLRGQPLIERVVTVTGAGVAAPQNLIARLGTPLADLIAAAGGYTAAAERLIMGGPMMGFALPDDSLPVVKATNCVLVAGPGELARGVEPQPCIRCGECATVCPASLLPQQLHWQARSGELERARGLGLMDCIECGCCDLACPSHIPLTGWFRHAKASLRLADAERQKSDLARERFEARKARLEHEQQEREARLKAKQAALAAAQRPGSDA
jgi:electron transport complex protein RnfC